MSGPTDAEENKKAAHVKWQGKTIALGTFSIAEAEEKCQRAKTLTKAWRQSMNPKPSREWVMAELERLGVRIVAGRRGTSENALLLKQNSSSVGRASTGGGTAAAAAAAASAGRAAAAAAAAHTPASSAGTRLAPGGIVTKGISSPAAPAPVVASYGTAGLATGGTAAGTALRRDSFTTPISGGDGASAGGATTRRDSFSALLGMTGSGGDARRRTSLDSLGFAASLLSSGALNDLEDDPALASSSQQLQRPNGRARRNSSLDLVSFLKNEIGFFDDNAAAVGSGIDTAAAGGQAAAPEFLAHRPLVGGGAASTYEAARVDHYRSLAEQQPQGSVMQRRLSGAALRMGLGLEGALGLDAAASAAAPAGSAPALGGMPGAAAGGGAGGALSALTGLGPNATPGQHYEMLKLHHMNLLQEIQETTMMMNLYQQQMLQEQQQQIALMQGQMGRGVASNPAAAPATLDSQLTNMANQLQCNNMADQLQSMRSSQILPQQANMANQLQSMTQNVTQGNGGFGGAQQQQQTSAAAVNNRQQTVPGEATDESADEIRKLKEEIAARERKMQELTRQAGGGVQITSGELKRRVSDNESEQGGKRTKMSI